MTHSDCLKMILLLTCTMVFTSGVVEAGSCHMNGQCGKVRTLAGLLPLPCAVDRDPAPVNTTKLSQEAIDEFENLCTAYANLTSGRKLCCNHQQVTGIIDHFLHLRSMLGHCPSAMFNIASFFCAMACDPNQSSFLQVTETNQTDNTVRRIRVNVDPKFRDTLYASAAGVAFLITRGPVIGFLCNDSSCDPNKLLKYLGHKDPAPFDIDYDFVENGTAPHIVPVSGKQCFEAPSVDEWPENPNPCSCTHCPARCIPAIDFNDGSEKKSEILFAYDMVLVCISVIVAITAVSLAAYVWYRREPVCCLTVKYTVSPSGSASCLITPGANNQPSAQKKGIVLPPPKEENPNYIVVGIRCWCKYVVFKFPILTILFGIALVVVMSCGLVTLKMESDPVLLWSAPDSRARIEKTFFDQNFGPFFRVNRFIISISDEDKEGFGISKRILGPFGNKINVQLSGIFRKELMAEILSLQLAIKSIPTYNDVCFKPVSEECMVQSPLNFFQSNASRLNIKSADETKDYADHLVNCMKNPLLMQDKDFTDPIGCLSEWGGPTSVNDVFGGFSDPVSESKKRFFLYETTAFIITIHVKNSVNKQEKQRAELFEKEFLNTMAGYKNRSVEIVYKDNTTDRIAFNVSYYSDRSFADEIERQSSPDVTTMALSYLAMFLYVALSLGKITSFTRAKVSLGFAGVAIVLTSVTSSIGFLSFAFGESIVFNLIIIEVVSFLVLAVGVNNIFLMIQAIERRNAAARSRNENVDDELAEILSTGPSILISSASEAGCFFIGSLASGMPAVKAFATTAGFSLVILIVLQFTVFLSLLFLDAKRERRGKNPDVCLWPFFLLWKLYKYVIQSRDAGIEELEDDETAGGDGLQQNRDQVEDGVVREAHATWRNPWSKGIIPLIKKGHYVVLSVWILSILFSLHAVPRISVGLDQEAHLPADSYLRSFFADQKEKMRVGPPLFFVLNTTDSSFDFSSPEHQNLICSLPSCDKDSLGNIVKTNSQDQEMSVHEMAKNAPTWLHFMNATAGKKYISGHATSWLDEFLSAWITNRNCCSVKQVGGVTKFCEATERTARCSPCVNRDGRMKSPELFWLLLPEFLSASPSISCPSGGKAAYSLTVNAKNETVKGSYFSAYHTLCQNLSDYVNSIQTARLVADEIKTKINNGTKSMDVKQQVFPYSTFYTFYEQFLR